MDYIINPTWIYWAHVLDTVKILCTIIAIFAGALVAIGGYMIGGNKQYGEDDKDYRAGKVIVRWSLPVLIISFLVALFVPSEKILIEMLIAKLATKQNIELTADGLRQLIDYIAETIRSLK